MSHVLMHCQIASNFGSVSISGVGSGHLRLRMVCCSLMGVNFNEPSAAWVTSKKSGSCMCGPEMERKALRN